MKKYLDTIKIWKASKICTQIYTKLLVIYLRYLWINTCKSPQCITFERLIEQSFFVFILINHERKLKIIIENSFMKKKMALRSSVRGLASIIYLNGHKERCVHSIYSYFCDPFSCKSVVINEDIMLYLSSSVKYQIWVWSTFVNI